MAFFKNKSEEEISEEEQKESSLEIVKDNFSSARKLEPIQGPQVAPQVEPEEPVIKKGFSQIPDLSTPEANVSSKEEADKIVNDGLQVAKELDIKYPSKSSELVASTSTPGLRETTKPKTPLTEEQAGDIVSDRLKVAKELEVQSTSVAIPQSRNQRFKDLAKRTGSSIKRSSSTAGSLASDITSDVTGQIVDVSRTVGSTGKALVSLEKRRIGQGIENLRTNPELQQNVRELGNNSATIGRSLIKAPIGTAKIGGRSLVGVGNLGISSINVAAPIGNRGLKGVGRFARGVIKGDDLSKLSDRERELIAISSGQGRPLTQQELQANQAEITRLEERNDLIGKTLLKPPDTLTNEVAKILGREFETNNNKIEALKKQKTKAASTTDMAIASEEAKRVSEARKNKAQVRQKKVDALKKDFTQTKANVAETASRFADNLGESLMSFDRPEFDFSEPEFETDPFIDMDELRMPARSHSRSRSTGGSNDISKLITQLQLDGQNPKVKQDIIDLKRGKQEETTIKFRRPLKR